MFQWFLDYLEKEKKTEAYRRIYKRAIKERLFDVTHPYNDSDPDKTIIDRIRRRLKNHCKRYKIPYPQ